MGKSPKSSWVFFTCASRGAPQGKKQRKGSGVLPLLFFVGALRLRSERDACRTPCPIQRRVDDHLTVSRAGRMSREDVVDEALQRFLIRSPASRLLRNICIWRRLVCRVRDATF
jgi:hypothetical protein